MLLILLSSFLPEESGETAAETADPVAQIEARLEQLLSRIDGAGEVRVMVTLSDTGRKEYLREDSGTESWEDGALRTRQTSGEYITSGGSAVLVAEHPPEVAGVAVICGGGDRAAVQSEIYEVLYALYGLSTARISIEKMN